MLEGLDVPGLTVFEATAGTAIAASARRELSDAQVNCCVLTTCRVDQVDGRGGDRAAAEAVRGLV